MRFTRLRRYASQATVLALAGTAVSAGLLAPPSSAAPSAKAKKATTAKKAAKATKAAKAAKAAKAKPAKAAATQAAAKAPAFDPNRCTYAPDDIVGTTLGMAVVLDTSPGDAGTNTHLYNATFEQCVFNKQGAPDGESGRMRAILHVQRNGASVHNDLRDGMWESPCPAACLTVSGVGNSAVLTPTFGAGGGFTSGAWAYLDVLKGTTRVFVAVAPSDPSVNNGSEWDHANQIGPVQLEQAKALAAHVLAQL